MHFMYLMPLKTVNGNFYISIFYQNFKKKIEDKHND